MRTATSFRLRAGLRLGPVALSMAAVVSLAGCVATDYRYRDDQGGGYYYGRPSVEYREVIVPPAYDGYGSYYGPYGPYRPGYPAPYGYGPYAPYGYDYYGYGGYGAGPYRTAPRYYVVPAVPRQVVPQRPRSPWRDLDELRRRPQLPVPVTTPVQPPVTGPAPSASGLRGRIQRAKERAGDPEGTP